MIGRIGSWSQLFPLLTTYWQFREILTLCCLVAVKCWHNNFKGSGYQCVGGKKFK